MVRSQGRALFSGQEIVPTRNAGGRFGADLGYADGIAGLAAAAASCPASAASCRHFFTRCGPSEPRNPPQASISDMRRPGAY
jgi:hypothetical protein